MARNEEKQRGRLNRLWLQKEKEEGRVSAVSGERPRLAALHTATEVRRWIPSIKREMEHYLQQSQLIHYSERKITEFQEKIDALKKEYQRYLWKLRRLDPSCKEHPWKPRGYTRKRAADGKVPSWVKEGCRPGAALLSIPVSTELSATTQDEERRSRTGGDTAAMQDLNPQDAPLEFSNARSHPKDVWRRSSYNTGSETTNKLKNILLSNQSEQNGIHAAGRSMADRTEDQPAPGKSMADRTEDQPAAGRSRGILGLDCYSSSSSEDD